MAEPFLGELRLMGFNYPPKGWALCDGQLLPINQNQPLFALLGTTYGGNGTTNFALPDLRGRTPIHAGSSYTLGTRTGVESTTITQQQLPTHVHFASGSAAIADQAAPAGNLLGAVDSTVLGPFYGEPQAPVAMAPAAISATGGSQAHQNRQPYLVLSFCIALIGIFPDQN